MAITAIKGFNDILSGEVEKWQHIEATARKVFGCYGFTEIRVPIMEKTELFARSIGDATDIVFLDDQQVNFAGATELGIETIWFDPTNVADSITRTTTALSRTTPPSTAPRGINGAL